MFRLLQKSRESVMGCYACPWCPVGWSYNPSPRWKLLNNSGRLFFDYYQG